MDAWTNLTYGLIEITVPILAFLNLMKAPKVTTFIDSAIELGYDLTWTVAAKASKGNEKKVYVFKPDIDHNIGMNPDDSVSRVVKALITKKAGDMSNDDIQYVNTLLTSMIKEAKPKVANTPLLELEAQLGITRQQSDDLNEDRDLQVAMLKSLETQSEDELFRAELSAALDASKIMKLKTPKPGEKNLKYELLVRIARKLATYHKIRVPKGDEWNHLLTIISEKMMETCGSGTWYDYMISDLPSMQRDYMLKGMYDQVKDSLLIDEIADRFYKLGFNGVDTYPKAPSASGILKDKPVFANPQTETKIEQKPIDVPDFSNAVKKVSVIQSAIDETIAAGFPVPELLTTDDDAPVLLAPQDFLVPVTPNKFDVAQLLAAKNEHKPEVQPRKRSSSIDRTKINTVSKVIIPTKMTRSKSNADITKLTQFVTPTNIPTKPVKPLSIASRHDFPNLNSMRISAPEHEKVHQVTEHNIMEWAKRTSANLGPQNDNMEMIQEVLKTRTAADQISVAIKTASDMCRSNIRTWFHPLQIDAVDPVPTHKCHAKCPKDKHVNSLSYEFSKADYNTTASLLLSFKNGCPVADLAAVDGLQLTSMGALYGVLHTKRNGDPIISEGAKKMSVWLIMDRALSLRMVGEYRILAVPVLGPDSHDAHHHFGLIRKLKLHQIHKYPNLKKLVSLMQEGEGYISTPTPVWAKELGDLLDDVAYQPDGEDGDIYDSTPDNFLNTRRNLSTSIDPRSGVDKDKKYSKELHEKVGLMLWPSATTPEQFMNKIGHIARLSLDDQKAIATCIYNTLAYNMPNKVAPVFQTMSHPYKDKHTGDVTAICRQVTPDYRSICVQPCCVSTSITGFSTKKIMKNRTVNICPTCSALHSDALGKDMCTLLCAVTSAARKCIANM